MESLVVAMYAAFGFFAGFLIGNFKGYVKGFDDGLGTRNSFELLDFNPEEE